MADLLTSWPKLSAVAMKVLEPCRTDSPPRFQEDLSLRPTDNCLEGVLLGRGRLVNCDDTRALKFSSSVPEGKDDDENADRGTGAF